MVFLTVALIRPSFLSTPHTLWLKLGLLLSKVVNPIVMALIFFTIVTPLAFLMKFLGKDLLSLKFNKDAKTYWLERTEAVITAESLKQQF
jgi:large-conductance mechanosensitive channel